MNARMMTSPNAKFPLRLDHTKQQYDRKFKKTYYTQHKEIKLKVKQPNPVTYYDVFIMS